MAVTTQSGKVASSVIFTIHVYVMHLARRSLYLNIANKTAVTVAV
jgi:hypothetical protein